MIETAQIILAIGGCGLGIGIGIALVVMAIKGDEK